LSGVRVSVCQTTIDPSKDPDANRIFSEEEELDRVESRRVVQQKERKEKRTEEGNIQALTR
jgi:hypothetical protein